MADLDIAGADAVSRAWSEAPDPATAIAEIAAQLGDGALALVCLFLSPEYAGEAFEEAAREAFGDTLVVGCTTAGEITPDGMRDNSIVALGFSAADFCAGAIVIDPNAETRAIAETVLDLIASQDIKGAGLPHKFAMLLNDGLARAEDRVIAAISPMLSDIPYFGGSAGDGLAFQETRVLWRGAFRQGISVLTLVHSRQQARVFRIENFHPGAKRMVVTEADPEARLVSRINDEPAAEEYARIVGNTTTQLSPFVFASHPVMVQAGGDYHVRAIQKVEENGTMRFFSAIDEGLVLTIAEHQDILDHLDQRLRDITGARPVEAILGFDCVLRKIEVTSTQRTAQMSDLFARYNLVGFNTYGEQFGALHVNQTLTGVVIFREEDGERP